MEKIGMTELNIKGTLGLTWSEALKIAQDRERWRDLMGALRHMA